MYIYTYIYKLICHVFMLVLSDKTQELCFSPDDRFLELEIHETRYKMSV